MTTSKKKPVKKAPAKRTVKKPEKKSTIPSKTIKKAVAKVAQKRRAAAKKPLVKKPPVKKRRVGRPTKYTKKLADRICALLTEGLSMRTICEDSKLPTARTLFRWLRTNDEFCQQYTRAKQESADALTDEMLDIADNAVNDWMERKGKDAEGYELNGEHVQRSRLRIDTRKWLASKLKPKKYGDKLHIDNKHRGVVSHRDVTEMSEEELQAELDRED